MTAGPLPGLRGGGGRGREDSVCGVVDDAASSVVSSSRDGCVKLELLLALPLDILDLYWLCRLETGGGGGVFLSGPSLGVSGTDPSVEASVPCMTGDTGDIGPDSAELAELVGGGGNGLFRSDGDRTNIGLGGVIPEWVKGSEGSSVGRGLSSNVVGENVSNDTVCGPGGVICLPCRCRGIGGFAFLPDIPALPIRLEFSS